LFAVLLLAFGVIVDGGRSDIITILLLWCGVVWS
jgi:hypothetical protein